MDDAKKLLEEEIVRILNELPSASDEEAKELTKRLDTLYRLKNESEKLEDEKEDKKLRREIEKKKLAGEAKDRKIQRAHERKESKDRLIKDIGIGILGIAVPTVVSLIGLALHVKEVDKVLLFEEHGTISSLIGKNAVRWNPKI